MALKEVLIAAYTRGPGRTQAGDIVDIREPKGGIGLVEGRGYILIVADDADLPDRGDLRVLPPEPDPQDPDAPVPRPAAKWRYNLPISDLRSLHPEIDAQRLADPADFYQPRIDPDPETGSARRQAAVSDVRGRITRKEV